MDIFTKILIKNLTNLYLVSVVIIYYFINFCSAILTRLSPTSIYVCMIVATFIIAYYIYLFSLCITRYKVLFLRNNIRIFKKIFRDTRYQNNKQQKKKFALHIVNTGIISINNRRTHYFTKKMLLTPATCIQSVSDYNTHSTLRKYFKTLRKKSFCVKTHTFFQQSFKQLYFCGSQNYTFKEIFLKNICYNCIYKFALRFVCICFHG